MIYLFNHKEELIKIIPTSELYEAVQTVEMNKIMYLDVEFRKINYDIINEAEYAGHFYNNTFYLYRIIRNGLTDTNSIKCVHILFDELKSNGYIRDKRPSNMNADLALNIILKDTRWNIGKVETNAKGTTNWYDKSKLDALSDFLAKWNVELDYRIVFDGHKITARYVDVYDKMGSYTGKRLVYGSNAIKVTAETSKANIYTALIGRGKGEEKTDENGQATGGYGRRIDFKDVVWQKSKGNPVDKPLGQEFIELEEATKKFGFSNGQPRVKIVIFEDCTDKNELLELTYKELLRVSRPQVSFITSVYKIGNVELGDEVNIIRRDLDLFYKARVFKIERNLIDNRLSKISLGDYIKTNEEKNRQETKNKLESAYASITAVKEDMGVKVNNLLKDLKNGIELQYFNDKAYNYELSTDNKWKLPAGYYSFNRPIDNNPDKVIYMGAGKIMIANRKRSDGSWDWSTFGTGDGFTADLVNAGHIKGNLIEANSIDSEQIASSAITADKIAYKAITGDKIQANSITADMIKARTIRADNIEGSAITHNEIRSETITNDEIRDNTITSQKIRDITVDILRPGRDNRIIFEGHSPGDNDVKSLDATGSKIRLKYDSSNYVAVGDGRTEFFTGGTKTWTQGGNMYADNINNTSDVRAKENIGYLDHSARIKPNTDVRVEDITTADIVEFMQNVNIATYNYQFENDMQIGAIAQDIEKFDKVKKYLVKTDEKRKYVNMNNLINMQLAVIKYLINEVDNLKGGDK